MPTKLLLLSVGISISSLSQSFAQSVILKGTIKESFGKPLIASTIYLYSLPDSVISKITITDSAGNYEIPNIKNGKYYINASHINYQNINSAVLNITGNNGFTVPLLTLTLQEKKLASVVITSSYQKPLIEVTADKIIFNVESSINSIGSNAFELLQKSPGVATDKDDNISMKGKNGVRIYIDGRSSPIEGADLAAYLKSINSINIAAIEMISNPSAKYDASGNAGIINIRLKKNNTLGLTAALTSGLNFGRTIKKAQSASINYRSKALNLFSNYSFNEGNNYNTSDLYRIQNDTLYNQKSTLNIKEQVHNIKVGADFFASQKSTIGLIYTGNFTNNTSYSASRTPSSYFKTGIIDRVLYATNTIPAVISNENINLNYHFEDTTGHEINIDADHGFYKSRKTSFQPNTYVTPAPETLLSQINYRNNTPIDITINTAKADYVTPFKKGKLSIGAKISFINTNNTFSLYNEVGGQIEIDQNRSYNFIYKENINAGYLSYFSTINKSTNLQVGLRVENTATNSLLKTLAYQNGRAADKITDRNYTDFFPNAAVTFTLNTNNNLNLNYSRRIDRPNYSDLNPFEIRVDELTFIKGNAFLQPQYTNIFQLTHTYKNQFVTSFSYSHINNFSTYITDSAKTIQTYITKKNLASQDITSLNFSAPFDFTKWWNLYTSITIFNSYYRANFGVGKVVNININSISLNAINTFKLGKGYSAELSGFFSSPTVVGGTFKTRSLGSIDAGIQKRFWKERAAVKLSGTDIFRTLTFKGTSNYSGTQLIANSVWESRQFRINFSYRFGGSQVKQARDHNSGNEEEKQRTSSNNNPGN